MGGGSKSGRSLQLSDWWVGGLSQTMRPPSASELDIKQARVILASDERRAVIGIDVEAGLAGPIPCGLDIAT